MRTHRSDHVLQPDPNPDPRCLLDKDTRETKTCMHACMHTCIHTDRQTVSEIHTHTHTERERERKESCICIHSSDLVLQYGRRLGAGTFGAGTYVYREQSIIFCVHMCVSSTAYLHARTQMYVSSTSRPCLHIISLSVCTRICVRVVSVCRHAGGDDPGRPEGGLWWRRRGSVRRV